MELANYQSYQEYKKELDGELQKTAEGFVRIGYLLKVARDTDILQGSGYDNVVDFAKAEYGLDKTQVSRFISINSRFSIDGCSDRLLPEYQGYGYAKLTIMLQIPEEIAQELTPAYTKSEIQAVKEEIDEEKKVSDVEMFMESMNQPEKEMEMSLLKRTLKKLGEDNLDLWEALWNEKDKGYLEQEAMESVMAPAGDKNYSVRLDGIGRVMLTMKDQEDRITITNVRTLEKETYTKAEMRGTWSELLVNAENAAGAWKKIYKMDWPKGKVAPVQPEKKLEPKKESKVTKAKVPEKPKKPSTEPVQAAVVEEPQLEGQMSVEDYPGVVPEGGENHGTDNGMAAGNDQPREPDRSGDKTTDGGSEGNEEAAGGTLQCDHEGTGAPEGGGREADHENLVNQVWWKWMDLRENMPANKKFAKEKAKALYDMTVKLAAALEALINEG